MGTQKKKKNTVAKKVVDKKNVGAGAGSAATPGVVSGELRPGTDCAEHIRSIFQRDAKRVEVMTRSMPDRVLIDLTSDLLRSPDMYPKTVTAEDRVVMLPADVAMLRVRRELFLVRVSREVQDIMASSPSSSSDDKTAFMNLAPKAVGLATLLAEGMRGSFVFTNWFIEMFIRSGTTTKDELMSLTSAERVKLVAIGLFVFIRATHEVYNNERLYFPGNLIVTLRYTYGMFYSPTNTVARNGNVYCAAACLLALGTFESPEIRAALDEICIPIHERGCFV
jgi:hypothetical protein